MKAGNKIVCLTALDAPTGRWCARAEVDIVLVGDSLGMTSLGMKDTLDVTIEAMESATAAVERGISASGAACRPLLVVDMPAAASADPVTAARRFLAAGGDAVKVECHHEGMAALHALRAVGIEVMAHVGLLPQESRRLGGYPLQGKTPEAARAIIALAQDAAREGAFSCVVEKVPAALGRDITAAIPIPTIGIGAGRDCDGQVLVLYDMLGIFDEFRPRFVRRYAQLGAVAVDAVRRYAEDVRSGTFPSEEESFS